MHFSGKRGVYAEMQVIDNSCLSLCTLQVRRWHRRWFLFSTNWEPPWHLRFWCRWPCLCKLFFSFWHSIQSWETFSQVQESTIQVTELHCLFSLCSSCSSLAIKFYKGFLTKADNFSKHFECLKVCAKKKKWWRPASLCFCLQDAAIGLRLSALSSSQSARFCRPCGRCS